MKVDFTKELIVNGFTTLKVEYIGRLNFENRHVVKSYGWVVLVDDDGYYINDKGDRQSPAKPYVTNPVEN